MEFFLAVFLGVLDLEKLLDSYVLVVLLLFLSIFLAVGVYFIAMSLIFRIYFIDEEKEKHSSSGRRIRLDAHIGFEGIGVGIEHDNRD